MDIKFLGTGGAFNVEYGNSSALIQVHGKTILLDCGHSVFPKLVMKGKADAVDAVLLTHFHDDHIGSLSSLILYHQLVLNKGKLKIVYPSDSFRTMLEEFLSFSIGKTEERVTFIPISDMPGLGAIDTYGQHVKGMQTWAYYFEDGEKSIVYSGDLGAPKYLFEQIEQLEFAATPMIFHEIAFVKNAGHTWYKDLVSYQKKYEIYGYHLDPRQNPKDNPIPLVIDQPNFLL